MFTGLVQGIGTLLRTDHRGADAQMVIKAHYDLGGFTLGESVAVDGACLTVANFQGNVFTADVSAETLDRTTLGRKKTGARFNLERALSLGDRLGGHLVSGHVDGIGTLVERNRDGRSWRLSFRIPGELGRYIVEKGSIAINGISLTVNGCEGDCFDVNIVPHTGRETTIGELQTGNDVNIETDIIGKYVEKMLTGWQNKLSAKEVRSSQIDAGFLAKHGFL